MIRKCMFDIRFIAAFLLAHLLMYITFQDRTVFWYFFSATLLLLVCISAAIEKFDDSLNYSKIMTIGVLSGALLFFLFWVGNLFINRLELPFISQITTLYQYYAPSKFWHYLLLMFVIAPGEEIFWRGFIQKRLLSCTNSIMSIILSTILYTSVHLYADNLMLSFAALFAGFIWGWLYVWKRSIRLVIVSHLIFDLFLFVILPFR